MTYSYPDNIPDYIKNLPEGAQKVFVKVFNETVAEGKDEDTARQAGWGAVKNLYEKVGDKWVRKADDRVIRYVASLGELPPGDGDRGNKFTIVQVFRTGVFRHPLYGKFTITDETLRSMEANFKAKRPKPPTEMVVDYEHMSAVGEPRKAPAAGWVKALEAREGGLFATIEWTESAMEHIRKKEYRFISPEWHMDYRDKESGKGVGPVLLSVALTNRPFIEGMQPVVLSERLEDANSRVLVLSEKMIGTYVPDGAELMAAEWDTQYINDLPDSCFAYIEPGGEKDEEGKTVPRALRHLPYRKADGSVDLPHLRNALARLEQTDLPPEAKAKARAKLEEAAEKAGVGEAGQEDKKAKEETVDEKKVREILGIGEEDDIMAALQALVDEVKQLKAEKAEAETAAQAKEVDADVADAIQKKLLLPKQEAWAKALRGKDPEAFKAYIATAVPAGPDTTPPKGKDGDTENIQLSDKEIEIGKKMGVSKEELTSQKKRDAEAAK